MKKPMYTIRGHLFPTNPASQTGQDIFLSFPNQSLFNFPFLKRDVEKEKTTKSKKILSKPLPAHLNYSSSSPSNDSLKHLIAEAVPGVPALV